MLVRVVAILAIVAAVAAACGGDGNERRDAVDEYVRAANTIQNRMRTQLTAASQATRAFGTKKSDIQRARPRLARATRTLAKLERRLARLDPPPEARRLHGLLLELVALEGGLMDELRRVTVSLPQLDEAARPVAAAGIRLQTQLRAAKSGGAQAGALDLYRSSLAAPLAAVRAIDPPPLLQPLRTTQLATLTRLRATAADLAAALRKRREAQVTRLVQRFQAAARMADTTAAQRGRIAAIKSYNARVRRVSTLAAKVQRERDRLDRDLD